METGNTRRRRIEKELEGRYYNTRYNSGRRAPGADGGLQTRRNEPAEAEAEAAVEAEGSRIGTSGDVYHCGESGDDFGLPRDGRRTVLAGEDRTGPAKFLRRHRETLQADTMRRKLAAVMTST
jgi:hypothetical protein